MQPDRDNTRGRPVRTAVRTLAWLPVLLAAFAWSVVVAAERISTSTVTEGFRVEKFHEPPNETNTQYLLEGETAELQQGGEVLLTVVRLQTFSESGATQMVVRAPHCVYDPTERTVSSDGPLHAHDGAGKFQLDGVGFLWQETRSDLIISNRALAILQRDTKDLLKP